MARDEALLDDPLLTTMGLLAEAYAGLVRCLGEDLEQHGLSNQWFEVLLRLARSPEHRLRMTDLAAQTTLTPSGLTRAVDRLAAAGLVERQACPTDRRSAYATLTEAGRKRLAAALPGHLAILESELGGALSERDLALFQRLARQLRDQVNPCAAVPPTP